MKKEILLYFALLLWFVVPAEAQLTIFAPDMEAKNGDTIEMDFKVTNFDSVLSMQYSLNWDSTVVRFVAATANDELSNFNSTPAPTNFINSKPGILRVLWLSGMADGESLNDSTSLFTLKFALVGQPDSSTVVKFTDTPIPMEILAKVNGKNTTLSPSYVSGTIKVEGTGTPTRSIVDNFTTLYQNEPNPFEDFTFVKFETQKADDIDFQVFDLNGRLIFSHKEKYGIGQHQLKLDANLFPMSGTYLYRLVGANVSLTKKLIVIQ